MSLICDIVNRNNIAPDLWPYMQYELNSEMKNNLKTSWGWGWAKLRKNFALQNYDQVIA